VIVAIVERRSNDPIPDRHVQRDKGGAGMKRQQEPEQPTDERLREVLYCIREGLRKLVPCAWGAPPYTRYGSMNSDHSAHYDPEAKSYLVVSLRAWYARTEKAWVSQLLIQDGDDFLLQRWSPFTWEEWQKLVDLYDQVTSFDSDMFTLLEAEGFS
jgi:hypothetical protein